MEIVSNIRVHAVLRRTGSSDTSKDFYDCIPLDRDEFFIGRARESNFCIPADGLRVSRNHAVIRRNGGQWSIKSLGQNGVAVNKVELPRNQQMAIQHMDIINFSSGDNYVYTFRVESDSSEVGEEPVAKKRRIPLANRNYPSLKDSPEAFENRDELIKKNLELEESVARANLEKQKLIEQKELVVQQLIQEKNVLQERLEEESRLKEETMNELAHIKRSHQSLEQELEEARRGEIDRSSSTEQELERVREELRVQKELNEQQHQQQTRGRKTTARGLKQLSRVTTAMSE